MGDFLDRLFVRGSTHYSLRLTIRPASAFSILLINDDIPERWEATFSASEIRALTTRAGLTKAYATFAQMIQLAIAEQSAELSFDIISPLDVGVDPAPDDPDDRRYLVIVQTTQFDSISYPLPLARRPFSTDELRLIIRQYREDNRALREELERVSAGSRAPPTPGRARTPNPARSARFLAPDAARRSRTLDNSGEPL
jgi:hypothetical protein